MNRKYKIGDIVIFIDKEGSDIRKREFGVSLYRKIAKITYIDNELELSYYLEFRKSYDQEKFHYHQWCNKDEFKLAIDHLKFKKWVKG